MTGLDPNVITALVFGIAGWAFVGVAERTNQGIFAACAALCAVADVLVLLAWLVS